MQNWYVCYYTRTDYNLPIILTLSSNNQQEEGNTLTNPRYVCECVCVPYTCVCECVCVCVCVCVHCFTTLIIVMVPGALRRFSGSVGNP